MSTAVIALSITTAVSTGTAGYLQWRLRLMTSAYNIVHQALRQAYHRSRHNPAAPGSTDPARHRNRNGNRR